MKALVVDDEAPARAWLSKLLRGSSYFREIEQAETCQEAKQLLSRTKPDVVFLDIGMPRVNGMDFAAEERDLPPVIFVTAHESFAVRAFEAQAVDYLLKPVGPARLERAVQRLLSWQTKAAVSPRSRTSVQIAASYRNELRFIESEEISHFSADGGYANFSHKGFDYTLSESLNSLEKRFAPLAFLRVGRHALVNLRHVSALHYGKNGMSVRLRDDVVVPVSRRAIATLKEAINRHHQSSKGSL